jgi:hypothetical protein
MDPCGLHGKFKLSAFLDEIIGFFNLPNPSRRTVALGSTQPLTEMSTWNLPEVKGCRRAKLTSLPPSLSHCLECVSLDVSQLYGPPRPVTEIILPCPSRTAKSKYVDSSV